MKDEYIIESDLFYVTIKYNGRIYHATSKPQLERMIAMIARTGGISGRYVSNHLMDLGYELDEQTDQDWKLFEWLEKNT